MRDSGEALVVAEASELESADDGSEEGAEGESEADAPLACGEEGDVIQ